MSASFQPVLLVALGVALAAVLVVLGAVWVRLKALPVAETARLVRDLAKRQKELETLLARLEGARPPTTRRVDRAERSAISGPTLIAIPNMAATPSGDTTSAAAELSQKFAVFWALADAGASVEAIARQTGQPIGQVELILALRRPLSGTATHPPGGRA